MKKKVRKGEKDHIKSSSLEEFVAEAVAEAMLSPEAQAALDANKKRKDSQKKRAAAKDSMRGISVESAGLDECGCDDENHSHRPRERMTEMDSIDMANGEDPGMMGEAPMDRVLDEVAARELELYVVNDGDLYRQQLMPILKTLQER